MIKTQKRSFRYLCVTQGLRKQRSPLDCRNPVKLDSAASTHVRCLWSDHVGLSRCWEVQKKASIALWSVSSPICEVMLTQQQWTELHAHLEAWSGVYMEISYKHFWNLSKVRRTQEGQLCESLKTPMNLVTHDKSKGEIK